MTVRSEDEDKAKSVKAAAPKAFFEEGAPSKGACRRGR